jgi:hypothetical protein
MAPATPELAGWNGEASRSVGRHRERPRLVSLRHCDSKVNKFSQQLTNPRDLVNNKAKYDRLEDTLGGQSSTDVATFVEPNVPAHQLGEKWHLAWWFP